MKIEIKNRYLRFILKVIYSFRVLIIIVLGSIGFYKLAYSKTAITCAKFKEYSEIRGGGVMILEYKVHNKLYKTSMGLSYFKREKLDSLEYCDCVELEYSVFFPSNAKGLVDRNFVKGEYR